MPYWMEGEECPYCGETVIYDYFGGSPDIHY